MSCLPLLFDLRDGLGLGLGARPENVPAASAHIELLLEKHGNGEMGVNSESPAIGRAPRWRRSWTARTPSPAAV